MVQPKSKQSAKCEVRSAKRWGIWIWTTAMTVVLVAYGFGQTHWCRTTEVTRMLMQHLGITEEKIRAVR